MPQRATRQQRPLTRSMESETAASVNEVVFLARVPLRCGVPVTGRGFGRCHRPRGGFRPRERPGGGGGAWSDCALSSIAATRRARRLGLFAGTG